MEVLLLLGLLAVIVLALLGGFSFLSRRRAGTVLAVPLSARTLATRPNRIPRGGAASSHK